MALFTSLFPLALLVSLSVDVLAVPHPSVPAPLSMNLRRRRAVSQSRSYDDVAAWAQAHKLNVEAKYGNPSSSLRKRSGTTGQNMIVNQKADSSFFGSLAVGTPPVAYDVILDTGSADLWLAGEDCTSCAGIATFDYSKSSSFKNESKAFQITYGSGDAGGVLAQDVVQMAGFSVPNQVFAVCDEVSDGLLNNPVSGLLGLAFDTIASSKATPLWQTLASSGAWAQPVMAFQLTRFNNDSKAQELELGGTFTMGGLNSSLYTGSIDYNPIPANQASFWLQTISSITSQGSSITLDTGSQLLAAIDTGTTLIGGPSDMVAAIYENIPNAQAGTGQLEGYYVYPCDTTVNVTMSFGGRSWPISNADFQAEQLNQDTCMGAFFSITTGDSAPAWIVGDTFLKNVYSVFQYSSTSPAVGFAQLSATALAMNGVEASVPSPTIGSAAATVTATGSARDASNGALSTTASSLVLSSSLSILLIAMTMFLSVVRII